MSDPSASLTLSTDERDTMFNDHHFTGPYAPSIPDEDVWADFGDHAEDTWTDVEADADTLTSAGWGTDEDYGYYGGEDAAMEGHLFGWDA